MQLDAIDGGEVHITDIISATETIRVRGVAEPIYLVEDLKSSTIIGTGKAWVKIKRDDDGDLVMYEYEPLSDTPHLTSVDDESDSTEEQFPHEQFRDMFRCAGRALCMTIITAQHSGGRLADEVIAACDRAWVNLADSIIEFTEED